MGAAPKSLVGAVVVLVAGAVVVVIWYTGLLSKGGTGLPSAFTYDVSRLEEVAPELIGYEQTEVIALTLERPRAVAVGPNDVIYVVGDRSVSVLGRDGTARATIECDNEPQCVAVGGMEHQFPGRVYVGMRDHIEVFSPEGTRVATWNSLGERAVLTSIALADQDVYVADAGGQIVVRYDTAGERLGEIGRRDPTRGIRGFIVPSPYFDVAMAPDGLLRVTNPGCRQVEAYTPDGDLELQWGKASFAIEGFCGCCNPANLAVLPDGRIVTAEKGLARVKVYDAMGDFECVVVGPKSLGTSETGTMRTEQTPKVIDVATDSEGRVLVLDPTVRRLRIFEPKGKPQGRPERTTAKDEK